MTIEEGVKWKWTLVLLFPQRPSLPWLLKNILSPKYCHLFIRNHLGFVHHWEQRVKKMKMEKSRDWRKKCEKKRKRNRKSWWIKRKRKRMGNVQETRAISMLADKCFMMLKSVDTLTGTCTIKVLIIVVGYTTWTLTISYFGIMRLDWVVRGCDSTGISEWFEAGRMWYLPTEYLSETKGPWGWESFY